MECGTVRKSSANPRIMTAPQDPPGESSETINLSHSFARDYWCTRLNTNIADLKQAVQAVGPNLADVKRYLDERAKERGRARKEETPPGQEPGGTPGSAPD
jgi:hypothetical protein